MQQEIVSVVFSFIKPECVNNAIQTYQEAAENKEIFKGCLDLQIFKKINCPNEFMIVSKWTSIEARDKHLKSEYFKNALVKLKQYRQSDPIMANFIQLRKSNR